MVMGSGLGTIGAVSTYTCHLWLNGFDMDSRILRMKSVITLTWHGDAWEAPTTFQPMIQPANFKVTATITIPWLDMDLFFEQLLFSAH